MQINSQLGWHAQIQEWVIVLDDSLLIVWSSGAGTNKNFVMSRKQRRKYLKGVNNDIWLHHRAPNS